MASSFLELSLTTDHAVPISPVGGTATVTVQSGSTVFYSSNSNVSSSLNDGSIAALASQSFTNQTWLKSSGASTVAVTVVGVGAAAAVGTDGLVAGPGGTALSSTAKAIASNVKAFGAVGGARIVTDAAITTGQAVLTSASAAFTPSDVGKLVYVEGAGANIPSTNPVLQATLATSIQAFTNSTTVTLAANATTTVSAATAYYGLDDSAAFTTAMSAGPVYVPADNYLWSSAIVMSQAIEMYGDGFGKSVILAPATASNTFTASHLTVRGSPGANVTVNADVAAGATSFTTTTSPSVSPGDYVVLTDGTQTFNTWPGGTSNLACRGEMLRVVSVTGAGPFTVNTSGLIHDQYQVSNAARMQKLTMLAGIRVEQVEFRCCTPLTTAVGCGPMVIFEWCIDAKAIVRVRGNPGAGFQGAGCWDGDFYIDAEDLKDGNFLDGGAGGFTLQWWGYGGWASMCDRDCRYFINAKRVRHAFTNGGQGSSASPNIRFGVPRNIQVDGIASDCTNAGWDTHADGADIHFGKVDVHGGINGGIQVRAPRTTIADGKIAYVANAGLTILGACTQITITTNGAIALAAGVATTSAQASGTVVLSSTAGMPSAGVITAGGVSIKYAAIAGNNLTGCTCQAVASGSVLTGATVLVCQDLSGSANVISHAVNLHVGSIHIHDVFTGTANGKGIDCYAPGVTIDSALIHDIDSNSVWLRGTASSAVANCNGFKINGRFLNPGRGSGNVVFIEQAPSDVTIEGYCDGAAAGITNGSTTPPLRLNASGLYFGSNVGHPAADDFSSHGFGVPRIPVGRGNSRGGTSTLVAGTVTVADTSVTASSLIFISRRAAGGTLGHLSYTIVGGTSFTITSNSGTDTSTIDWMLVEKGAT